MTLVLNIISKMEVWQIFSSQIPDFSTYDISNAHCAAMLYLWFHFQDLLRKA